MKNCQEKQSQKWDNEKKKISIYLKKHVVFIFILILLIPFLIQLNPFGLSELLKKTVRIGTPRDWFVFWGAYLGSILSIGFAYLNTKFQLSNSKNKKDIELLQDLLKLQNEFNIKTIHFQYDKTKPKNFKKDFYDPFNKNLNNFLDKGNKIMERTSIETCDELNNYYEDFQQNNLGMQNIFNKIMADKAEKDTDLYKIVEEFNERLGKLIKKTDKLCVYIKSEL